MDSFTHIALGAATGEILLGKKIGKRALLWGAVANSFPDIDFVAALWLSPADNVLAHRGFTHSLLFVVVMTFIFYRIALYWDNQERVNRQRWIFFFLIQLGLHLFVDAFNAYGVGWFIPFDPVRISFHSIFVLDPFYSSVLGIVFILLLLSSATNKYRWAIAVAGIAFSFLYLGYALANKFVVSRETKKILSKNHIQYHRFFTTPTPLNTWLWFAVAEVDSGYHVGYRSVFDPPDEMSFTYVPRNEQLLAGWQEDHAVKQLKKFSQGYYTVEHRADTLVFNDLRFGQITGWQTSHAPFAFHFFVNYPDENLLVMQRGRVANWNEQTIKSLITRIKGNP